MPNRRRGEVALSLDGRDYVLRLTLGALAELEDAFKTGSLAGLAAHLGSGSLSSRELLLLLRIALKGGGNPLTEEALEQATLTGGVEAAVTALADLFALTFGGDISANP
jgi:Phage tail tube protein, GTA-gp10